MKARKALNVVLPADLRRVFGIVGVRWDLVVGALLRVPSAWGFVAAPWLIGKAVNELKRGRPRPRPGRAGGGRRRVAHRGVHRAGRRTCSGGTRRPPGMRIRDVLYDRLLLRRWTSTDPAHRPSSSPARRPDVEPIKLLLSRGSASSAQSLGTLVFAVVVMLLIDPELAGLALIPLPARHLRPAPRRRVHPRGDRRAEQAARGIAATAAPTTRARRG